jgi:tRNA(Ile)-lysidine synthase
MPLSLQDFERTMKRLNPSDEKMIVALSGGIDSMLLVELLLEVGAPIELAHVNFQLRGEESEADEQFVAAYAKKKKLILHVKRGDITRRRKQLKQGIQEAARQLRYEWFETLRVEREAGFVVTAHHADDQVETMLFHFLRGSGVQGLAGMAERDQKLLRPLLMHTREDIEALARRRNMVWREDSSNQTLKYTRNMIRQVVIPELEKINPGLRDTLLHLAPVYRETSALVRDHLESEIRKHVREEEGNQIVPISWLKHTDYPRLVMWELVKPLGFGSQQVTEIMELMQRPTGSRILSSSHEALRNRDTILLAPISYTSISEDTLSEDQRVWEGPVVLHIRELAMSEWELDKDVKVAQLDRSKLQFPLTVRTWQEGDRFRPLGMSGQQKISDFLIQQKVPLNKKPKVLVVESNNDIAWVVGMRISQDFAVSEATTAVWVARVE